MGATPNRFFQFSQEWEELLFQTNFLAVVSSLGYFPLKNFSDRTCCLCSKIRQREGAGGGNRPPPPSPMDYFLPIFLTMNMTFNLSKVWYGVR